jgi:hypothetical protein
MFFSLANFHAYVCTQFGVPIKVMQADNGTEFVNHNLSHFLTHNVIFTRLSCPYTSSPNGKAECMLCTINNTFRTLLIHAFIPPTY